MLSLDDLLAMLAPIKQELAYRGVTLTATKNRQPLQIPAPNADLVTCPECAHIFFESPLCPKCGAMLDAESYDDDDGEARAPTKDSPREVLLDRPVFNHEYPEEVDCEECEGRGWYYDADGRYEITCEKCGGQGFHW